MSIYGTLLSIDGDDHDLEKCADYVEDPPRSRSFNLSGKPCNCGAWRDQPIVYEGSHVLPSDDDRRGGGLEVAAIPAHVTRDGRDDGREGVLKDWLRLGVWSEASKEQYQGKPYVAAGDATVVLTRSQVQRLRDVLTGWLEREPEG